MRRVKFAGLAGVPGVVLTESDRRLLRSRLGIPGGGLAGACVGCSPSAGTDHAVAIEVAKRLGSPGLADAIKDPTPSPVFENAAKLAAATMESVKFRKDFIATVSGITSPQFAVLAGKTAKQLGGKKKLGDDGPYAAVLLLYMTGALDDASGRNTGLAKDYRKALKDLNEALEQAGSKGLNGLGKLTAGKYAKVNRAEYTAITARVYADVNRPAFREYDTDVPGGTKPSDPSRFYPPSRKSIGLPDKKTTDSGTRETAPDALDFAPFNLTVERIGSVFKAAESAGRDTYAYVADWVKQNSFAKTGNDMKDAAARLAAWIFRFAGEKMIRDQARAERDENKVKGSIAWMTLIRRYGAKSESREKDATAFEKFAGEMLAKASEQAVARTGQTGVYGTGSEWKPDPKSKTEQVPQGPEGSKYVGFWGNVQVDPKIRPEAIFLAQEAYIKAYRKEPTEQALNWYGSFGYGIDQYADYLGFRAAAQNQNATFITRVAELEAVRMAGSSPPPQDIQNNVNVFISVFNATGPALSATLSFISKAVDAATDVLCQVMKVVAGPETGGVLCAIFTGLIKFLFGATKGAIAALFSVAKALLGFIGKLFAGDWLGAFYELFAGVNTAVIFAIGGPIADLMGVPFLKNDEKGNIDSPDFIPSLERMGESLTKKNPFFLIMLVVNVIALIITPTPANVSALLLTLTPVMAMICVSPATKALRTTQDKSLVKYKNLPASVIESAIESLLRIVAGVIVGLLSVADAMKVIADKMARWAEKQGGVGPATVKTLQFFMVNLQNQFIAVTIQINKAFTNDQGFEMKQLTDEVVSLIQSSLALLPAFAMETGEFTAEEMKAVNIVSEVGASTVAEAKAAYDKIIVGLDAESQKLLAEQIMAEPKVTRQDGSVSTLVVKEAKGKPKLPLVMIGLAAVVTIGFMFKPKA